MADYILLIRNGDFEDFSPDEFQAVVKEFSDWAGRLAEAGKLKEASKLADSGTVIKSTAGAVTDGPFTETKDAVGGFFLIDADSMEAAVEIAKSCPGLKYGDWLEVRPIEM